jgi:hypothetical protein
MYLGICIAEFSAVYLGISSSVYRTIPLPISNYSDIFIEIIPLFITEFLNGMESLVNMEFPYDRISVVADCGGRGQGFESWYETRKILFRAVDKVMLLCVISFKKIFHLMLKLNTS